MSAVGSRGVDAPGVEVILRAVVSDTTTDAGAHGSRRFDAAVVTSAYSARGEAGRGSDGGGSGATADNGRGDGGADEARAEGGLDIVLGGGPGRSPDNWRGGVGAGEARGEAGRGIGWVRCRV